MNSSKLHIRRWVATVVVLAALVGGAVLSIGLRNWTNGQSVLGAPKLAVTVAHDTNPVLLGQLVKRLCDRFSNRRFRLWSTFIPRRS